MDYKQLKSPNLDPVVYVNGKVLKDWYEWCLATVETAFGTPRIFSNAWSAWNENPDRRQDRNWPRNVYFPIFFSGYGGLGHIAIAFVDSNGAMRIWTSPFEHVPYFYTGYTSVDALAKGYHVTYIGWSTSLAGVQLIAPVEQPPAVPMINNDQLTQLYRDILQRDPDVGAIQHYAGHYTYDFVHDDLLNSVEYHTLQVNIAAAQAAAAQAAADAAAAAAKAAQQAATSTPAGPVTVPTSTERYPIQTTVATFSSKGDAQNRTNQKGEIFAGATWYVYCEKDGMLNITQTPGTTSGTWINPADNVVPTPAPLPDPAAIKTEQPEPPAKPPVPVETAATIIHSFIPLMPDGSPVECKVLQSVMAVDALGHYAPITAVKDRYVKVYGTHVAGTHTFATVRSSDKTKQHDQMYGILITARDNFTPYLNDPYTLGQRVQVNWELIYDKVAKTIGGVFRALKRKK